MKTICNNNINAKKIALGVLLLGFITVGAIVLPATQVLANVGYVKPSDARVYIEQAKKVEIPQQISKSAQTKAPEPTTFALLGSGFIGMLLTFLRRTYLFIKRIFDIAGSLIGIVLTAPIMLLAVLLIKFTSKGPILYTQVRVGKDGKNFRMYKFRTMKVDAEKETGPVWAQRNDHRLIRVGGLMRKMRIDELPQFFNVLIGNMSLIGPRPERPTFVEQLKNQVQNYEHRLAVKPGITGLAQVRHRYDETIEDVKKKVKYDIFYIKNMNFWHDVAIAFRTIAVVFTGFGAR